MKVSRFFFVLSLCGCPGTDAPGVSGQGDPGTSVFDQNTCTHGTAEVRDTVGGRFAFDCERNLSRPCILRGVPDLSPPPPTCGNTKLGYVALTHERVALICAAQIDGDGFTPVMPCRPMACSCSQDCPGGGPCTKGLCQRPAMPLSKMVLLALCASTSPWEKTCDDIVATTVALRGVTKAALGACPDDGHCPMVPASCLQP